MSFYTETGELVLYSSQSASSPFENDILNITTNRSMGANAPTFFITLSRRNAWHKIIASNDLVVVRMQRPPESAEVVFVGLVDDVRSKVSIESGKPVRNVVVSGRGMIKAFMQFDIGLIPNSQDEVTPSLGYLLSEGVTVGDLPADGIIKNIMTYLADKFIQFKFSDGSTLFDVVGYNLKSREDIKMLSSIMSFSNYMGNMWQFMLEVSDEPFNELFWETEGGKEVLYLRPTPFNEKDWKSLDSISIDDEDVVAESLGRSDVETYSIFQVGFRPYVSSNDQYRSVGVNPLIYKPYYEKYGIKRLYVETPYTPLPRAEDKNITNSSLQARQIDLFNWNIKNNSMVNGTIILKGSNKYKVGTRLLYNSTESNHNLEFYIKSVTHQFINYGNWITVLEVIRGFPSGDRFRDPWNNFAEYTGADWLPQASPASAINVASTDGNLTIAPDPQKAQVIVQTAESMLSTLKYVFGSSDIKNGKSDCSAFIQYVYWKSGITLGRTTNDQINAGLRVDRISDLKQGDLVFFKNTYKNSHTYGVSHVGIYAGNGYMIHHGGGTGPKKVLLENYINSLTPPAGYLFGQRVIPPSGQSLIVGPGYNAFTYVGKRINNVKIKLYGSTNKNQTVPSGTLAKELYTVRALKNNPRLPLGTQFRIQIPVDAPYYNLLNNKMLEVQSVEYGAPYVSGYEIEVYIYRSTKAELDKAIANFGVRTGAINIMKSPEGEENNPPTSMTLTDIRQVSTNSPVGTKVADITIVDPDGSLDTHTIKFLNSEGFPANNLFKIENKSIYLKLPLSVEDAGNRKISIRATDRGRNNIDKEFTIVLNKEPDDLIFTEGVCYLEEARGGSELGIVSQTGFGNDCVFTFAGYNNDNFYSMDNITSRSFTLSLQNFSTLSAGSYGFAVTVSGLGKSLTKQFVGHNVKHAPN